MNYVAIDFETANYQRNSACQIGLAKVVNGEIVETFSSYINPVGGHHPFQTKIHGITEKETAAAPTFKELLPQIYDWIFGEKLIAYSLFDKQVLTALGKEYSTPFNLDHYVDVCKIAKAKLPSLSKHKMDIVAPALGIDMIHHHVAVEDAKVCAQIYAKLKAAAVDDTKPKLMRYQRVIIEDLFSDILADGVVDAEEAIALCYNLEDLHLTTIQPFTDLYQTVRKCIEDNVITGEESETIRSHIDKCIQYADLDSLHNDINEHIIAMLTSNS